jgi:hypothetical protein
MIPRVVHCIVRALLSFSISLFYRAQFVMCQSWYFKVTQSVRAVLLLCIGDFSGTFYSHAALGMATLIKASYPSCVSHVDLYTSLGKRATVLFAAVISLCWVRIGATRIVLSADSIFSFACTPIRHRFFH